MTEISPTDAAALAIQAFVPPTAAQLEAARDVVGRFAAQWAKVDPDALRELMHADTRNLIPPMREAGNRETVVALFRGVLDQLPDLRISVIRWAPTGDAVMIEWRASATLAGRPLSWTGVDRFNIRGDRMYEGAVYWDTRGLAERMAETVQAAQAAAAG
ncbi:nuclear transport factor 2 family protein [Caulobacter sp. KR2-114]|uniref:nuclear transport factor 2 family protein n=1 Tax=Caulobacter sp. KR2-114 TaxID=3400912 RepID=UPI003C091523